ncbi:MAG: GAF domain-containing protein [Verrucomicrobia bacterium]|nr:GAF domain-containing protein [Verrucomicrobiota bacterium]
MDPLQRLDQIERQAGSLLETIRELRAEFASSPGRQDAKASTGAPSDLRAQLLSMSSYIALSPHIEDDELLTTLLRCAMHVVRAGGAGLTLLDRAKARLVFRAAIGDGSEGIIGYEVPVEGSQHGLAFATGEVQASKPIHTEIESAAKAVFRNVLVAPLIVDGEPIGTMSAVNKQDDPSQRGGDRFTPQDMAAYKLFADLAALIVRQRLREAALKQLMAGKEAEAPGVPAGLRFGKDEAALMAIAEDLAALVRDRPDLVPTFRQLTGLLAGLVGKLGRRR